MKIWFMNCREVSRLVSESMDRDLSLGKKSGIRFHLMMCRYCARFSEQLQKVRSLVRGQNNNIEYLKMDEDAKNNLRKQIKQKGKK